MAEVEMVAPSGGPDVSCEILEERLACLRESVRDPRAGVFGPGSKVWEINREAVLFLGSGRAALLQLAHPWVAEAIEQHSHTQTDPLGRFHRTFRQVFAMVFGDLETAFGAARRVHAIHRRITGTLADGGGRWRRGGGYRANDPDALLWVHSTLWETSIRVFETVVRPLESAERERYYDETRRFAILFGLAEDQLPPDWAAFEAYNAAMWRSDRLAAGRPARELARFLFTPRRWLAAPALHRLQAVTAGLLPERLREELGLPFDDGDRRLHEQTVRWVRRLHRFLPARLRFVPPYVEARRRIAGRTGRDLLGEALTRLWIGRLR